MCKVLAVSSLLLGFAGCPLVTGTAHAGDLEGVNYDAAPQWATVQVTKPPNFWSCEPPAHVDEEGQVSNQHWHAWTEDSTEAHTVKNIAGLETYGPPQYQWKDTKWSDWGYEQTMPALEGYHTYQYTDNLGTLQHAHTVDEDDSGSWKTLLQPYVYLDNLAIKYSTVDIDYHFWSVAI